MRGQRYASTCSSLLDDTTYMMGVSDDSALCHTPDICVLQGHSPIDVKGMLNRAAASAQSDSTPEPSRPTAASAFSNAPPPASTPGDSPEQFCFQTSTLGLYRLYPHNDGKA